MRRLRAVFDDGKNRHDGSVRGMWSSGIVLESQAPLTPGTIVGLVVLSGSFDGERLSARIDKIERGAIMLDLMDLDTARWARLQALVEGIPPAFAIPIDRPARPPPADAPVFILSGGEEELGDPTDTSIATPEAKDAAPSPPPAVAPSAFELPSVVQNAPQTTAPRPGTGDGGRLAELERSVAHLTEDNERLKAENARLLVQVSLKDALEEELAEALARLETIEQSLKRSP